MDNYILRLLGLIIKIVIVNYIQAQQSPVTNFVINGSFEQGDNPTCTGQATEPYITGWFSNVESRDCNNYFFGPSNFHSPDLYDEHIDNYINPNCDFPVAISRSSSGAYNGSRYIAMSNYELIQTDIGALIPGRIYTLSLYIQLSNYNLSSWNGESSLKVYLARQKIKYKGNQCDDFCKSDYVEHQDGLMQEIYNLHTFNLHSNNIPYNQWRRISFSFRADETWYIPTTNIAKWLAFEVVQNNYSQPQNPGPGCTISDIFIDEVQLAYADYCFSNCSPSLGSIVYSPYSDYSTTGIFPNVLIANTNPFTFYVKNATGIDFTLFNTWQYDVPIFKKHAFDPNGLKDMGYDDYQFLWNGNKPDGTKFPQDVYGFTIRIWNCNIGQEVLYTGTLTYLVNSLFSFPDWPDIINYELIDCCDDVEYYQNVTLNGNYRKDVSDFITAGENVTSGTQGPVIVNTGANVKFFADNAINLEQGFTVLPNAQFEATLQSCLYGTRNFINIFRERTNNIDTNKIIQNLFVFNDISNPNKIYYFSNNNDEYDLLTLQIVDINGRIIKSYYNLPNKGSVDVSGLSKGVYIAKLMSAGNYSINKIYIE